MNCTTSTNRRTQRAESRRGFFAIGHFSIRGLFGGFYHYVFFFRGRRRWWWWRKRRMRHWFVHAKRRPGCLEIARWA